MEVGAGSAEGNFGLRGDEFAWKGREQSAPIGQEFEFVQLATGICQVGLNLV